MPSQQLYHHRHQRHQQKHNNEENIINDDDYNYQYGGDQEHHKDEENRHKGLMIHTDDTSDSNMIESVYSLSSPSGRQIGNHDSSTLITQRSFINHRAFTTGDLRRIQTQSSVASSYCSFDSTFNHYHQDDHKSLEPSHDENIHTENKNNSNNNDYCYDDTTAHQTTIATNSSPASKGRPKRRIPAPQKSADPPLYGYPARQGGAVLLADPPEDNPDIIAKQAAMIAFDEQRFDEVFRNSQRFFHFEDDESSLAGVGDRTLPSKPMTMVNANNPTNRNSRKQPDEQNDESTAPATNPLDANSVASIMRKGGTPVTMSGGRLPGAYSMHGVRMQGRRQNGLAIPMPLHEIPSQEEVVDASPQLPPPSHVTEEFIDELEGSSDHQYDFEADYEFSSDCGYSHNSRNHHSDDGGGGGLSNLGRCAVGPASRSSVSSTDGASVDLASNSDAISIVQSIVSRHSSINSRADIRPINNPNTCINPAAARHEGNTWVNFMFRRNNSDPNNFRWHLLYCMMVLMAIGGGIGVAIAVSGVSESEPIPSQAPSAPLYLNAGNYDGISNTNTEILQELCPPGSQKFNASFLPQTIVEAYEGYADALKISDPINSCTPNTLALLFVSTTGVQEEVSISSMYLLSALYFGTGGSTLWMDGSGWLETPDFCQWQGVECVGSHILSLELTASGLTGTIPSHLHYFADLEKLLLGGNQFKGPLPSELGTLSNLLELDISRNEITGTLPPELSGNTNIRRLDFSLNRISGTIPSEWVKMTSLMYLRAGANRIHSTIPTFLGSLRFLERIELQSNSISGIIPSELLKLTKLKEIDLSNNQIKGTIPINIESWKLMERFRSGFNWLTGTIPTQLGSLKELAELTLSGNQLTGQMPSELGLCTKMHTLTLERNQFKGTIPKEFFTSFPNLEILVTFSNTALTGTIGAELCASSKHSQISAVCDLSDQVVCECCTKKFCISY